jgi:hypothetical protein
VTKVCYSCNKSKDLRPYGPQGQYVCFQCAFATPESTAQTEAAFKLQLDAAGPVVLLDGTDAGPRPYPNTSVLH